MAICLNNLKLEIKTLEKLFSKSHELFQIVNASVDELTCRFISQNGKKTDIHANITVSPYLIFSLFLSLDVSSKKNGSMDLLRFVCVKKGQNKTNNTKQMNLSGVDDQSKGEQRIMTLMAKHLIVESAMVKILLLLS